MEDYEVEKTGIRVCNGFMIFFALLSFISLYFVTKDCIESMIKHFNTISERTTTGLLDFIFQNFLTLLSLFFCFAYCLVLIGLVLGYIVIIFGVGPEIFVNLTLYFSGFLVLYLIIKILDTACGASTFDEMIKRELVTTIIPGVSIILFYIVFFIRNKILHRLY